MHIPQDVWDALVPCTACHTTLAVEAILEVVEVAEIRAAPAVSGVPPEVFGVARVAPVAPRAVVSMRRRSPRLGCSGELFVSGSDSLPSARSPPSWRPRRPLHWRLRHHQESRRHRPHRRAACST